MGDNKNIFLAVGLSFLIMFGYDQFYLQPRMEEAQRQYELEQLANPSEQNNSQNSVADPDAITPPNDASADLSSPANVLAPTLAPLPDVGQVIIETGELTGSINLRGALFDQLTLNNHLVTLRENAENVRLLKPKNQSDSYYVGYGWAAQNQAAGYAPSDTTIWQADYDTLTPENPVTLSWDNGQGVRFLMKISVDDRFMFTVEQSALNTSDGVIALAPFGMIRRGGTPDTEGMYILHEGPIGVIDGTLVELSYSELEDDGHFESNTNVGGWMGITDKFWMTILIPDSSEKQARARFAHLDRGNGVSYRVDYIQDWQALAIGESLTTNNHFYAGAKIVNAIDDYEAQLSIPLFDRTIDWGWFYWLTRPIFKGLQYFFELTGNFGVAILLLTVVMKLILFPLANKSYVSMAKMKNVAPKMKSLQERYKDDRTKLQQEMMALYKKEGVNPAAGCLPMLLQIPVFFALYKVLYVTIEMRHQPFIAWITDLSAPDPLTPLNLFGLIPWDPPSLIAVGVLPILMGITMYVQQKLTPQTMEPAQQKIMNMLPIIFTFVMASFSAGLVLYWTWNSLLSFLQQWYIIRRSSAAET